MANKPALDKNSIFNPPTQNNTFKQQKPSSQYNNNMSIF